MIDSDQERAAQRVDFTGQCFQLLGILVVPGEQDDPANQRVAEALTIEVGESGTGDVDHQRTESELFHRRSTMT